MNASETHNINIAYARACNGSCVDCGMSVEECLLTPCPHYKLWWSESSGRIELFMTLEQAQSIAHQGRCDDDVQALMKVPEIASQLAAIDPNVLRTCLKEYGAWDTEELTDHDTNLSRILWLAGCDIKEQDATETR